MTMAVARWLAAACAALALGPALVALAGGADLDIAFAHAPALRASWYDATGAFATFAVALAAASIAPRRVRGAALSIAVCLALLALATWASLGDGLDVGWLSAQRALRPALGAALALAFAARGGVERVAFAPALAAVGLGAGLTGIALAADRADLEARVELGATDAAPTGAPDVLLIVIDTLRADALANAERDAPNIAALARDSLVFERAYANAAWTLPSMMALYSSRLPSSIDPRRRGSSDLPIALDASLATLPSALAASGYHTAGFVKNPVLAPGTGFERDFDVYEWVGGEIADGDSARQLVDAVLRWARVVARARARSARSAPYFAHVHFMDPHVHYRPPRAYWSDRARAYDGAFDGHARTLHRMTRDGEVPAASEIEQMRELYAGEVRYVDAQVGRLLASLGELGLVSPATLVVLTSDHGEQFGEHGRFEHRHLNIENVAVPLFLRAPGLAPARRSEPVSLVDLAPTVLALAGADPLAGAEGRDLLAPAASRAQRRVVSEFGAVTRVTDDRYSLVVDEQGGERFFDLASDPGEQSDLGRAPALGAEAARARAALRAHLDRHAARAISPLAPTREAPLDARVRAHLEALGYVDSDE